MGQRRKTTKKGRKQADDADSEVASDHEVGGVDRDKASQLDIEDQIVDFFEANHCFYAKDDPDYKNRDKKNRLLEDMAKELGPGYTAVKIMLRFTSHRTNYGKLRKKVKGTKSGSGALKLTRLQQWTLRRFAFLDPHMTLRLAEDLGSISMSQTSYDRVDDDDDEESEVREEEE